MKRVRVMVSGLVLALFLAPACDDGTADPGPRDAGGVTPGSDAALADARLDAATPDVPPPPPDLPPADLAAADAAPSDAPPPRGLFVSPSGSDTANGTADAPLKTIGKAVKMAQPGDTVTLLDGTYDAK